MLFNYNETEGNWRDLINNVKLLFAETEVNIPDACILGTFRIRAKREGRTRPVIVKLLSRRWKTEVFDKDESFKGKGIVVSSDLSKEKRSLKDKLRIYSKAG